MSLLLSENVETVDPNVGVDGDDRKFDLTAEPGPVVLSLCVREIIEACDSLLSLDLVFDVSFDGIFEMSDGNVELVLVCDEEISLA